MVTKLNFEFTDKAKWSNGAFEIDNLQFTGSGDNIDFDYNEIRLFLDGKLYEGGISTWSTNNLSTDALFESVLSSFLRENKDEYKNFDESWSVVFKDILSLKEWKNELLLTMPVYDCRVQIYTLELATADYRFYGSEWGGLMLNASGGVITDCEPFYFQGIGEELADIFLEKKECLYMSEGTQTMINEYGGKDWWIQEFSKDVEPDI